MNSFLFFYNENIYMSNKTRKRQNKKRVQCKKYKTCEEVPCGEMMNRCKPSYCINGSKNWGLCNMKNWGHRHLQRYCKSETKCKMTNPKRVTKYQVDAEMLHNKMPYIWRFLDRKTRKKMIHLAQQPLYKINIG
jgi:hypothetical protein